MQAISLARFLPFPYFCDVTLEKKFLAFFLCYGLVQLFFGEKIPFNQGVGFDGGQYANMARGVEKYLAEGAPDYLVQRILPSAVINIALRAAGAELSTGAIVRGFALWNFWLILVSVALWGRIGKALGLGDSGKWIGFLGLFINFAVMKFYFYYPVLTDPAALALSLAMIYCFLRGNGAALIGLTIAGAFTWPTLLVQGLLLFLFPRGNSTRKPLVYSHLVIIVGTLLAILAWFTWRVHFIARHTDPSGMPVFEPTREVGIAILLLYAALAFKEICSDEQLWDIRRLARKLSPFRVLAAAIIFFGAKAVVSNYSAGASPLFAHSIRNLVFIGVKVPFLFVVGHVLYFGPIVLLVYFHWAGLCRLVHSQSVGLSLIFLIAVIFSFSSEARHTTALFPVVVVFLAKYLDQWKWEQRPIALFTALAAFCSKFWYPINSFAFPPLTFETALSFPWQNYFMHHAQFQSYTTYLIQAPVVAIAAMICWKLFRVTSR